MKWDQQRPAKAAVERCRALLDIPPTGAVDSLFLIYPPTGAQWRARPGGLWGGFPNPAKLVCTGSAKNRLASSQPHRNVPRTRRDAARPSQPHPHPGEPVFKRPLLPSRPLLCLLFSHIPTDGGAVALVARRALGCISQPRKTPLYGVPLKIVSRARTHAEGAAGRPRPGAEARMTRRGLVGAHRPPYPAPPNHLPYTRAPTGLPYTLCSYSNLPCQ